MVKNEDEFSEETIKSLVELREVLRKIHERLLSEGYTYKNGQFTPPKAKNNLKSKD